MRQTYWEEETMINPPSVLDYGKVQVVKNWIVSDDEGGIDYNLYENADDHGYNVYTWYTGHDGTEISDPLFLYADYFDLYSGPSTTESHYKFGYRLNDEYINGNGATYFYTEPIEPWDPEETAYFWIQDRFNGEDDALWRNDDMYAVTVGYSPSFDYHP
jgi:hypothetical protein